MSLKVLIVDDEQPARERLAQLLEDFDGFRLAGMAANGEEALARAAEADIVLLDIRMPGMDGLEAAAAINQLDDPPAIVFTTAYDEYAIDAFEARAIGYVMKPVRRSRLRTALDQARRVSRSALNGIGRDTPRRHLCANRNGELRLIPVERVHYLQADQKYVRVVHDGGEDLLDESLKTLETEFGGAFVRIHRSTMVAVARIRRIVRDDDGRHRVVMRDASDDNSLPISRRHVADVRRRLKG